MSNFSTAHDTTLVRLVTVADEVEAAAIIQKFHQHGIEACAGANIDTAREITFFVSALDLRRARELIASGDDHPDTVEDSAWQFSRCNDAPAWNGPKSSPLR